MNELQPSPGDPGDSRAAGEPAPGPAARRGEGLQPRMRRFWRALSQAALFVLLTVSLWMLSGWLLQSLPAFSDRFLLALSSLFPAALAATVFLLRFPRPRPLAVIGLPLNGWGVAHLGLGFAFGAGLVLSIVGTQAAAGWVTIQLDGTNNYYGPVWEPPLFVGILGIILGSAGEELLFRGYGFQQLIRATNPGLAIAGTSAMFGVIHQSNPEFSQIALLNTALFGGLFGLALVRHRTLWLPYGMHFGWNFSLAAIGANLSGLKIKLTAVTVTAVGPSLWTGGAYGPEASIVATVVVLLASLLLWKSPAIGERKRMLWD